MLRLWVRSNAACRGGSVEACLCVSASQGGTGNLSHVTPNTSLGFVQATPSRVLPSPTVNTREALGEHRRRVSVPSHRDFRLCPNVSDSVCASSGLLGPAHSDQHAVCSLSPSDVIMDMFQAPTLLEDPFSNTSALMAEREAEPAHLRAGKVVRRR